jgi:DNA processing protein
MNFRESMQHMHVDEKKIYHDKCLKWLAFWRRKGVGPKTFWKMIESDAGVVNASEILNAEKELNRHHAHGFFCSYGFDETFPKRLFDLHDYPPVISVAGDVSLFQKPIIALVGARNASSGGKKIAYEIARELGKRGCVIISGLARGIDTAAHQGALETGTIAVLAGGIDVIYPPENKTLYDRIKENGNVISEMPFGMTPSAPLFPRRNRLIAALSHGVVVIEAAHQSGSLITATYANELGRDIFVVPGSPLDPRSRGGNALIKQGAMVCESADDIVRYYQHTGHIIGHTPTQSETPLTAEMDVSYMLEDKESLRSTSSDVPNWFLCLGPEPMMLDDIVNAHPTLNVSDLLMQIAYLELDGHLYRTANGQIARRF